MSYKACESYINTDQMEYFKNKLLTLKQDILENWQTENENAPLVKTDIEFMDVVSSQIARNIEIKAQELQRKTLRNIEKALQRIEDKSYGYCEETGEPIGINRLEANPVATLSIEAQTLCEKRHRIITRSACH